MLIGLFAVNNSHGIGHNGSTPWPTNKDDLKWFRKNTIDQIVVMGRNTWDSTDMPSPLPGRTNVVITSGNIYDDTIIQYSGDLIPFLKQLDDANPEKNIYVIGGANVLLQANPILELAYITRIDDDTECDTTIDLDNFLTGFNLINTINIGPNIVEEWANANIFKIT